MIGVIDYGRGNLFSLAQALRHLGAEFLAVAEPAAVGQATSLLLPGVGAFGDAMAALRERKLTEPIKAAASRGVPILGICLGMQLLADTSQEFGNHAGLGLVSGLVRRLPDGHGRPGRCRIPNVGWRTVRCRSRDDRFADLVDGQMFYFNHSYRFDATDAVTATISVNDTDVAAIVTKGNVVGFQFHPEKSGSSGLRLICRFLDIARDQCSGASKALAPA